jgi:hypothetical protein
MDRYSKTVLTVIAVTLLWIAIKELPVIADARASPGAMKVHVVDMNWSRYKPLPVKIEGKVECR